MHGLIKETFSYGYLSLAGRGTTLLFRGFCELDEIKAAADASSRPLDAIDTARRTPWRS